MARKQFKLPDVGEGLTDGEILRWYVQIGDRVTVNQTIVEIETAKAAVELPCPYEGEVVELLAEVGQVIDVGAPIITIETEPGSAPAAPPAAAPAIPAPAATTETVAAGLIGGEAPGGRTAILVGDGPRTTPAKRRPRRAEHAGAHTHTPPAITEEVPGGPMGT